MGLEEALLPRTEVQGYTILDVILELICKFSIRVSTNIFLYLGNKVKFS
jgi:hypothetical protein